MELFCDSLFPRHYQVKDRNTLGNFSFSLHVVAIRQVFLDPSLGDLSRLLLVTFQHPHSLLLRAFPAGKFISAANLFITPILAVLEVGVFFEVSAGFSGDLDFSGQGRLGDDKEDGVCVVYDYPRVLVLRGTFFLVGFRAE